MQKLALFIFLIISQLLKAQNVGIGTTTPLARLHVTDSSVLFSGTTTAPPVTTIYFPPVQGPGTRMFWYPALGAFRAGYIDGSQWDKDLIGQLSFASGYNTVASGRFSVALGNNSTASGDNSFALGNTTASGNFSVAMGDVTSAIGLNSTAMGGVSLASGGYSTAMGYATTAIGNYSTAMGLGAIATGIASTATGEGTIASGDYSIAIGNNSFAKGYGSFSTGLFNDISDNPAPGTPAVTDRIFQIGNGEDNATRSNAITVLRNGNTGIGTFSPNALLQFGNSTTNRKIVLWEGANNDHQFYGFGINASVLRYQTPSVGDDHVFYSGSGTSSSAELLRIKGNGNIGVGVSDPAFRLDVGDRMRIRSTVGNSAGLWLNDDINTTSPAFIGMKLNDEVGFYGQTGAPGWRFYINTTTGNGWMQGTLTQNSDMRLKKNITSLQKSLQKIMKLSGYHYYWKNESNDNRLQTGVLAQEVQKLFPELVTENKDGILAVNYSGLIPVLIESIKEQQRQIDELKKLVKKIINK